MQENHLDRIRVGHLKPQLVPHLFLSVGAILIATVLVVNYTFSVVGAQAMQTVRANTARVDRLDELLLLLLDAESSVRGYLLTHSKAYLPSFARSRQRLEPLLDELAADYRPDEPVYDNYQTLKGYAIAKRDYLAAGVDVGRMLQNVVAGESGAGKMLMDEIRSEIGVLKGYQLEKNAKLEAGAAARLKKAQIVMYALAAGSFALIIALFVAQQRQVRLRGDLNALRENENVRLEAK
ncbi:MAG: CHASE3 domain-containing protein, partial [Propionivibrio sp.]